MGPKFESLRTRFKTYWARLRRHLRVETLRRWLRRPENSVTVLLLTKGHLEVRKLQLNPARLWMLKIAASVGAILFILSTVFLLDYLIKLPTYAVMKAENVALRKELQKIQFHMDSLQSSLDRIGRFDQKLRAMTEIDREFAKMKGPLGQGGSSEPDSPEDDVLDLSQYEVEGASLRLEENSNVFLERRDIFLIQKLYSWAAQLYRSSNLQEQSLEELFEVLRGREIQLAATPSILPVRGWITSHFGHRLDPFTNHRAFHKGIDLVAREGAPIVAPADGVVSFAGAYGSYGRTVMVFHGYGISTLYAHTKEILVKSGQRVRRGDVLALVGSSGRSTGPHLHYEVIVHGMPVDPRKYVLDRTL